MLPLHRFVIAVALAPLGTVLPIYIAAFGAWILDIDPFDTLFMEASLVSVFALIVAYAVMWSLGLIAVWLSRRHGWTSARHYALLGLFVGTLPFVAYSANVLIHELSGTGALFWERIGKIIIDDGAGILLWTFAGGVCGICSALLFWRIAGYCPLDSAAVTD